ncbi:MAG: glucose 1-dehydrogenase [Deltaproteobacteria bacterium]|nr:glucose 1-dehydrogenase [Deltaproteobacteria bacterium]
MGRVANKVAIVTGGAQGIGRATSLLLAAEGAKVAVVDILEKEGKEAADKIKVSGGKAWFWQMDVSKEQEIEKVFAEVHKAFGRIDILVNNAGITGVRKPTHEITEEEWDRVMDINTKSVFFCTKHAVPYMRNSGGGSIVNVASVIGMVGSPGAPPYVASKAAVRLMSRTDALIYAKDKIRVNAVCPGYVWTPLIEGALKAKGDVEAGRKALASLHPLGHIGEAEDAAYGILYLVSDESKFVTGSDLVIDGGYTAQ